MADDYYKTLGVSKGASADEIRKAYRKLARVNHPDAKPNDAGAAERFKAIQEAYDVLNDADKRKKYDQFGPGFEQMGRGGPPPGGGFGGFEGGSGPIDLGDLFGNGGIDLGDFFGAAMRGGPSSAGSRRGKRPGVRGEDIRATVRVPFETAVTGGSVDVRVDRGGQGETLGIKIPAGVSEGQVIRLAGQGHPGQRDGLSGDLLLRIEIEPHAYFRREGANLLVDVPISPSEAVLGTKVEVPTLSEGHVIMKVPAGTSSGVKLRLRGKGAIDPQTKQPGDQFVVIKIVLPKHLPEHAKDLYKQLAEHETSVRDGLW
ncbi:DnaJ C-terminal domain-containing protein [Schlesneria paludicola]|uniref:DnaJ C-terminal domain-containing protein n=1 Tax=Schlesneria paludicola TaxID=360056 RepID=UPI00029A5D62|nr:DnaJ C-terminal domain-containing protein [Schlesneria paludicola]